MTWLLDPDDAADFTLTREQKLRPPAPVPEPTPRPRSALPLAVLSDGRDRSWMARGLCNGGDSEHWFPTRGSGGKIRWTGRTVCLRCPVKSECLNYALGRDANGTIVTQAEPEGMWGSLTPNERRALSGPSGQPIPLVCSECGRDFTGYYKTGVRFCSNACQLRSLKKRGRR